MKKHAGYRQLLGPALCVAGGILLYLILVLTADSDTIAAWTASLTGRSPSASP